MTAQEIAIGIEQAKRGELCCSPTEIAVRPSDGKVDPAMYAVEKQARNPGRKEREDRARLLPPGS